MTSIEATPLNELQADLCVRLATGGDRDLLRRVVVALGDARETGQTFLDLAAWCQHTPADGEAARPQLEQLVAELHRTGVVGVGGADAPSTPLVLDSEARLYMLRHYRNEQRIQAFVRARLEQPALADADALRRALQALDLLPDAPGEPDWQLVAIAAAARRSFTVLCGGPGTGKTTTVARMLAVLLRQQPHLRIAIAAPTGKAAARLGESLQQRAEEFPELAEALQDLEPETLHRLLGYQPRDDRFRYGCDHKLPFDLIVVDEASMVDAALFAELCDALADDARLVLVGDQNQLSAVAPGQVLGDLCRAARPERGVGRDLADFVRQATGMQLPVQAGAAPIADATVALRHNYRFGHRPGIGAFAQALLNEGIEHALAHCEQQHGDFALIDDHDEALARFQPHLLAQVEAAASGDPEQALAALQTARVLTAHRLGPTGAVTWNRRIEALLEQHGHRTAEPFYIGRPILVTSNDHQSRIWNGDLGVVGRDGEGRPVVWLRDQLGELRTLNPRRLPAHETAWAMTVHKAQGSEFDHILLLPPNRHSPLHTPSLIYTGVTRARLSVVYGTG